MNEIYFIEQIKFINRRYVIDTYIVIKWNITYVTIKKEKIKKHLSEILKELLKSEYLYFISIIIIYY